MENTSEKENLVSKIKGMVLNVTWKDNGKEVKENKIKIK